MTRQWATRLMTAFLLLTLCWATAGVQDPAALFAIGSSARAQGIGGAFGALADDEGAVLYAPAALGWHEGIGLTSLFVQQFGGVLYGAFGITLPYVGANMMFLDSGRIPVGEGSTRFASQGVTASIGLPIGMLGIGARWRYYRLSSPSSGSGWSLDPSLVAVTDIVRVSLMVEGAASSPIVYGTGTEEAWPRSLRLGAALRLRPAGGVAWNASMEATGLFTSDANLALGLETWIGALGARVGHDGDGPTFGLSLVFPTLQLDWAFSTREDLGNSHRVGLTLRF